ncbi:unnamed protein product [Lupinus luteus]|uniref:Uncharacterized protein n=1 Tax=Lupinus luteus TaxID=3873 RepID=A0AAV1YEL3_LUPLU
MKDSGLSDKDKSYYVPFHLLGLANEFLALWLFLVASSFFLFSKNLNSFGNCRIKAAEEVSLHDRIIPNAKGNIEPNATSHKYDDYYEISYEDKISYLDSLLSIELEEDTEWISDSMSFELCSPEDPSTPLSGKNDSFYEISDIKSPNYMDSLHSPEGKESVRESYFDSLFSLKDDTEWLLFEDPSTSLSQKCDYLNESDIGSPSYWDSLLKLDEKESSKESYFDSLISLEDEDTGWLSFEDPSTPLSQKCDSLSESDIRSPSFWDSLLRLEEEESDGECYFDSLLSLEDEDTQLLSFEDPLTPLSQKCDSSSESDIGSPCYWNSLLRLDEEESDRENYFDSLLSLEDEDTGWLSFENPSAPLSQNCDSLSESDIGSPSYWISLLRLEEKENEWTYKGNWSALSSVSSVSSLTTTVQTEEFFGDEPLFWPFEEKLNWNYEKSCTPFCSSPRKRLVSEATSPTSVIKECKQNITDALCSVKKKSETSRLSMWSKSSAKIVVPLECEDNLNKTSLNENFASNFNDLPLGMKFLAMDQDLPIETLVGLKEFDGHEGLDSEFNECFGGGKIYEND